MEKLIRFDWAIKHLLRNKANFDILEGFLSALLKDDIHILHLLESESNQEDEDDKFNRVDVLVENHRQQLIVVEVQVRSELDFFHRIAYGTAKLLTEYLDKGQAYRHLKKVISVSITYFDLGAGDDYLYHGTTRFDGLHTQDQLNLTRTQYEEYGLSHLHQIFPEYYLIRIGKFSDVIQDPLDEWVYMFKHSQVKAEFTAKHIQIAGEKLRVLGLSAERCKAYERFMENRSYEASMLYSTHLEGLLEGLTEGRAEGRAEGLAEGLEKGKAEQTRVLAQNMLAQGIAIDSIQAITGLSVNDIEKLKNQ